MDSATLLTLTVITVVAVASPVIADLLQRFRVSAVVLELIAGIIVGPQLLGIADPTSVVESLSDLGLAFLMFLAGYEIDFRAIKGKPLNLAISGWGLSLVAGLAVGVGLHLEGLAISGLIVGLALTTTALGTMLPMWRDSGLLSTPFGGHALAIGTIGEFGPIVAIALLLSGHEPGRESVLLIVFALLAVGAAALAVQPRTPRMIRLLQENLHTSAQLPVRISMAVIIALLWVANSLGLDMLLGAFTAGIVVHLGVGDHEPVVRTKLEAIGYGFLVPIFFVASGMQLDLDALIANPGSLLRLPVFVGLFLLVRGLPVVLYRNVLDPEERWPLALFSATALPLVVVITQIGTQTGRLLPETAAALVGAAMVSVMVYPSAAFALLRRRTTERPSGDPDEG